LYITFKEKEREQPLFKPFYYCTYKNELCIGPTLAARLVVSELLVPRLPTRKKNVKSTKNKLPIRLSLIPTTRDSLLVADFVRKGKENKGKQRKEKKNC